MECTTLCYLEKEDRILMLHRVKEEGDLNKDKWLGIGGHTEVMESPEDCIRREVLEETGLTLHSAEFRGIITFISQRGEGITEYMFLFTSRDFSGDTEGFSCDEGELLWIPRKDIWNLNLWEGDRVFFHLLEQGGPFFSLKMIYDEEDRLKEAVLNDRPFDFTEIINRREA